MQLYEINPETFGKSKKKQSIANQRASNIPIHRDGVTERKIDRLMAKLNKIKVDILFDESEAERRWSESRATLAKEIVERKRLGIRNEIDPKHQADRPDKPKQVEEPEQDDGDPELLGNLFSDPPDSQNDIASGTDAATTNEAATSIMNTRNFGKWTGVNPRRVLEEACKSR